MRAQRSAAKRLESPGLKIISRNVFWVWLLTQGIDLKQIDQKLDMFLREPAVQSWQLVVTVFTFQAILILSSLSQTSMK